MLQKSNHSPSCRWTWCNLHPTEFSVFRPSLIESLITGCLCMPEKNRMGLKFRKQDSCSGDLQSSVTGLWFHHEPSTGLAAVPLMSGWGFVLKDSVCTKGKLIMSFMFMVGAILTWNGPIAWLKFALGSTQRGWRGGIISLWLSQGKKGYWEWANGHCLHFNPSVPVWQCLSECSAQECCKLVDVQGDGGFAMIRDGGEAGKGGWAEPCDVLGCPFLFKSLLLVKTSKLGRRKCCENVAPCGLWGVKGVVCSQMLKESLKSLVLFLYLFLHLKSKSGL